MAGPTCEFGVFGMGVMGQNLALNIAERGYKLAAYNRPDEFQVGNPAFARPPCASHGVAHHSGCWRNGVSWAGGLGDAWETRLIEGGLLPLRGDLAPLRRQGQCQEMADVQRGRA